MKGNERRAYVVQEVCDTVEGNLAFDDYWDEHEQLGHPQSENVEN